MPSCPTARVATSSRAECVQFSPFVMATQTLTSLTLIPKLCWWRSPHFAGEILFFDVSHSQPDNGSLGPHVAFRQVGPAEKGGSGPNHDERSKWPREARRGRENPSFIDYFLEKAWDCPHLRGIPKPVTFLMETQEIWWGNHLTLDTVG